MSGDYTAEVAIEVKACETTVLDIQATTDPGPQQPDPQPASGAGRIELSLVQMLTGSDGQQTEQPVTTISSVVLRRPDPMPRTVPVYIRTDGDSAGTGTADDVPAGTYTLELLPVIYFDSDKHTVNATEKPKIETMGKILNGLGKHGVFALTISGHADIQGDKTANLELSRQRIKSVENMLKPLVDNSVHLDIKQDARGEPEGKTDIDPKDRRVDFELVRARGS